MKRLLFHIILIIASFDAFAQVRLEARLDSNTILLGDQVNLRISVVHPTNIDFIFPTFKDSIIANVEVISSSIDTLSQSGNTISVQQNVLLTSFEPGEYVIPEIAFPFRIDEHVDTIFSPIQNLTVYNVAVDSMQTILDIKPIMDVPLSFREMLPYLLIGLAALLLIFIGYYLWKKYRKNEKIFVKEVYIEPAHLKAFRELEKLKEQKLWQQGLIKEYYTNLTDIIRIYIEERFGVPAMECTSDQILEGMKKSIMALNESNFNQLREMLYTSDMVKFAKGNPLPAENDAVIQNAEQFIKDTMMKEIIIKEDINTNTVNLQNEAS